ncbi:MoxR family ATPase [uncultured Oscillibacter sp.]|uniref:AAA family ATPase n=1 Tax=uncultured Oscillibacter sp. TaxID=876091 RepID=UPI0025F41DE0|nr:MoxR family ATPase [uncultured Oscillibacter sp.]
MDQESIRCREQMHSIVRAVGTAVIGKEREIALVLLALIGGGHVLLEDVPGVGKTGLVSALSRAVSCDFKRIQFTPDIMPSDITGFSVYNQKTGEFEFRPGAAMSNFVLADEINRASAKAQASLLEVMEEKQVTIDGETHILPEPFVVLATQNPLDNLGTYPLPEAQIDRFQMKLSLGYPSYEQERRIMAMTEEEKAEVPAVANGADILAVRRAAATVRVDDSLQNYIADLVTATRNHRCVALGVSPRGSIALYRLSRARALYEGRDYVLPDDVKFLAPFVLAHRLILRPEAKLDGVTAQTVIQEILDATPIPFPSGERHGRRQVK